MNCDGKDIGHETFAILLLLQMVEAGFSVSSGRKVLHFSHGLEDAISVRILNEACWLLIVSFSCWSGPRIHPGPADASWSGLRAPAAQRAFLESSPGGSPITEAAY